MSTTLLDNPVSVQELPDLLPMLDWITGPERVARLSYDHARFSPILKRDLANKKAALVVRPRSTDEIRQVVSVCANSRIPITIRGGGTGNTGQSVPLHGGIILDLSGYNAFCWTRGLTGRAQAGRPLPAVLLARVRQERNIPLGLRQRLRDARGQGRGVQRAVPNPGKRRPARVRARPRNRP